MQLPLPILLAAQQVLDRALLSQPDINEHLDSLDGCVACIRVDSLDLPVYLLFNGNQVEIARFFDGKIDVTLSGSPSALVALNKNTDGMFNGDITVTGDVGMGHQLKTFFDAIDIDWEEHLSGIIGDAPAHHLGNLHRSVSGWLQRSVSSFLADSGEYVQEEIRVVAPNSEVQRFCRDVDDVRGDVDRLEARFKQLERDSNGSSSH